MILYILLIILYSTQLIYIYEILYFIKAHSPTIYNIINTKQFSYDFGAWLSSIKLLEQYRFDSPVEVTFYTSQNQYDMLESYFERYGQSDQSLGKILTRLNVTDLLRQQKKNITV